MAAFDMSHLMTDHIEQLLIVETVDQSGGQGDKRSADPGGDRIVLPVVLDIELRLRHMQDLARLLHNAEDRRKLRFAASDGLRGVLNIEDTVDGKLIEFTYQQRQQR